MAFYSDLFKQQTFNRSCMDNLLDGIPQLTDVDRAILDAEAVGQMAPGKTPGLDGIPVDFYKHFWRLLGEDLREMF